MGLEALTVEVLAPLSPGNMVDGNGQISLPAFYQKIAKKSGDDEVILLKQGCAANTNIGSHIISKRMPSEVS